MQRWIPFLIFGLILAGAAVLISDYADDQAELIVEGAPAASDQAEIEEAQARACDRAHARYNAIWDESLEHPGDRSYEEKLEIALGEVMQNCEGQ